MALANTIDKLAAAHAPIQRATPRIGFFRKIVLAMMESRQRQAEAEMARHAGLSDRMTDEIERKMVEQLFSGGRPLL